MDYEKDKTMKALETLSVSGYRGLTDEEIIALLIAPFDKHKRMPEKVIDLINKKPRFDRSDLKALNLAEKAIDMVMLCDEWEKRHSRRLTTKIRTPDDVYRTIKHLSYAEQEQMIVVALDGSHTVIDIRVVTVGLVNLTLVHPREVFKDAIRINATAIIIAHNHPSGCLEPSPEDKAITERLVKASKIIGINILDHEIITPQNYFSFKENGLM